MSLEAAAAKIRDAFDYDPGHSDLDNEQPITLHITLGDWRRLNMELRSPSPEEASTGKLTKPAQIGNTIFEKGIAVQTLIERAYREYDYQHTPEARMERLERIKEFQRAVNRIGDCPECGVNRFLKPCPLDVTSMMKRCPMVGEAYGSEPQERTE